MKEHQSSGFGPESSASSGPADASSCPLLQPTSKAQAPSESRSASRTTSVARSASVQSNAVADPADFSTYTTVQTNTDPEQTRAELPESYDTRGRALLLRIVLAGALFLSAAALTVTCVWKLLGWMLGEQRAQVVLAALATAELIFAVYWRRRYVELNAQPTLHEPEALDAQLAFDRLVHICKYFKGKLDPREYLCIWLQVPLDQYDLIKKGNVEELLAYGFHYKSMAQMRAKGLAHVPKQMEARLERAFGIDIPEGYTPGLVPMQHLWEPLRVMYRPLVFYLGTEFLSYLNRALLLSVGAQVSPKPFIICGHHAMLATIGTPLPASASATAADGYSPQATFNGAGFKQAQMTAGHAPALGTVHGSVKPAQVPILMLHGVGVGLLPYINFIRCLLAADRPLILLEYRHVSMRMCRVVPTATEIAHACAGLLDDMQLQQVCVVAHSYGTFVASAMCQRTPERVQSVIMLDPVCLGMFMPSLLHCFIYRPPRVGHLNEFLGDCVTTFISRDLYCAAAMCRRFYWSDLNCWAEDIPSRSLIALSGRDSLIHVHQVIEFVHQYCTKILYRANHIHGQFILDSAWQQQIVADIVRMGTAPDAATVQRRLTQRMGAQGMRRSTEHAAWPSGASEVHEPAGAVHDRRGSSGTGLATVGEYSVDVLHGLFAKAGKPPGQAQLLPQSPKQAALGAAAVWRGSGTGSGRASTAGSPARICACTASQAPVSGSAATTAAGAAAPTAAAGLELTPSPHPVPQPLPPISVSPPPGLYAPAAPAVGPIKLGPMRIGRAAASHAPCDRTRILPAVSLRHSADDLTPVMSSSDVTPTSADGASGPGQPGKGRSGKVVQRRRTVIGLMSGRAEAEEEMSEARLLQLLRGCGYTHAPPAGRTGMHMDDMAAAAAAAPVLRSTTVHGSGGNLHALQASIASMPHPVSGGMRHMEGPEGITHRLSPAAPENTTPASPPDVTHGSAASAHKAFARNGDGQHADVAPQEQAAGKEAGLRANSAHADNNSSNGGSSGGGSERSAETAASSAADAGGRVRRVGSISSGALSSTWSLAEVE